LFANDQKDIEKIAFDNHEGNFDELHTLHILEK